MTVDKSSFILIVDKKKTDFAKIIASAITVNVTTAMPSENVTKLELYLSVTHITVVVFLSTLKLLYPKYQTHGIMKSLVPKNYCDAVLVLHPNVTPSFEI